MGIVSKGISKRLSKYYAVNRSLAISLLIKQHVWVIGIFSIAIDLSVAEAA